MNEFYDKASKIKVGDPLDPTTQMGPQISEEQLERIERYVQLGQEEGASLVLGGKRPEHLCLLPSI